MTDGFTARDTPSESLGNIHNLLPDVSPRLDMRCFGFFDPLQTRRTKWKMESDGVMINQRF